MNIVICEDEEIIRRKVSMYIDKISLKHDLDLHTVLSTENPDVAFEYIDKNNVDILILDIDLKREDTDGIKLGQKLRKINKNVLIIFLSSRLERIFESFTCIPFDFIAKPAIAPRLEEALLNACNNKQYAPHGNFVKIKNNVINLSEVLYIEKQLSKSIFHTTGRSLEIYINFTELFNCLTDNFIQINRSFIINKDFIISVNELNKIVLLKNNETLKYSLKYVNNLGGILSESNS